LDEEVVSEEAPSLAEEGGEKEVKAEEEISLEEFDFEESTADEEAPEIAEDIVVEPSEDVAVASIEEEGQEAEAEEPEEEAALPPILEKEPRPRRSIGAPFLALLIIGLVGAGAYTAYTILGTREIKIPFLESLTGAKKSDKVDPGNMRIAFVEQFIYGKFVDNNKTGRIFVIKGKIRNDYSEARNFIRVRGALYLKDGKEAQSRIVYCGNALSDTDLKMLDVPTINKRLGNRFGDSKSNFKIPSGKILPFTVVFSNLPRDLGEFSVEVVGSVPA
jgi:hypothetical protein